MVGDQSEADILALFCRGLITHTSRCRLSNTATWRDVNEFFPLLKYQPPVSGVPVPVPAPTPSPGPPPLGFSRDERGKPALTSALKAGWICFGLGLAIAWIFPPAYAFYSIALILAIVAMCTHQVNKGVILLLSSFVGMGTSILVSVTLAVGFFALAVTPAVVKAQKDMEQVRLQQEAAQRNLLAAQQRVIASLNPALPRQPFIQPTFQAHSPSTPPPSVQPLIQSMTQHQLFEEIARVEKQQRELRKAGRDLPPSTRDYLEQLRNAPMR